MSWPKWMILVVLFTLVGSGVKEIIKKVFNEVELTEDLELLADSMQEAKDIAEKHRKWTAYRLRAQIPGPRPCLRCPDGISTVTLNVGDTWKYGITTSKKGRYSDTFVESLGLFMSEIYQGTYEECKAMEISLILRYRHTKESVKPEGKLIRPPGNPVKS